MSNSGTNRLLWYGIGLFIAVVVAAVVLIWPLLPTRASDDELAAKAGLQKLGALVVMDSQQNHVSSVNLSTMQLQPVEGKEAAQEGKLEQAIELLADLPYLSTLDASRTAFGDSHAEKIGALTQLKSLVLTESQISDAGLAYFTELDDVQSLILSSTKISGAGLSAIGKMSDIKVLDLSNTNVTGSLDPLANLGSLDWLVLRSLTLEENALTPLAGCKSLGRIGLVETTVSDATVEAFKALRPAVAIDGH